MIKLARNVKFLWSWGERKPRDSFRNVSLIFPRMSFPNALLSRTPLSMDENSSNARATRSAMQRQFFAFPGNITMFFHLCKQRCDNFNWRAISESWHSSIEKLKCRFCRMLRSFLYLWSCFVVPREFFLSHDKLHLLLYCTIIYLSTFPIFWKNEKFWEVRKKGTLRHWGRENALFGTSCVKGVFLVAYTLCAATLLCWQSKFSMRPRNSIRGIWVKRTIGRRVLVTGENHSVTQSQLGERKWRAFDGFLQLDVLMRFFGIRDFDTGFAVLSFGVWLWKMILGLIWFIICISCFLGLIYYWREGCFYEFWMKFLFESFLFDLISFF